MSSQKKIEANRRNAQRSCGPTSDEGKARSRLNALKHGMRANLMVLPGEDPEACQGRVDGWIASLGPRNEAERYLAERTARITLQLDRIERAHVARVTASINNAAADMAAGRTGPERDGEDVRTLGRRLFWDARGPLALYPHPRIADYSQETRISWSGEVNDPCNPERVVDSLELTAQGCAWLLDRWAELRSVLEQGQVWQSPDKLRAARLLGRQPADALYDRTVGMVFVACYKIDPSGGELFHEIWNDMKTGEIEAAKKRLKGAPPNAMQPRTEAEARQALLSIVDQSVARLKTLAEAHRKRAEANAGLTADLLAFDASPEGERLRRYEISCSRTLIRTLDAFDKMRQTADDECDDDINLLNPDCTDEGLPCEAVTVGPDLEIDPALGAGCKNEPMPACDPVTAHAVADQAEPAGATMQFQHTPEEIRDNPVLPNEPTATLNEHDSPELPNELSDTLNEHDNSELPIEPTDTLNEHDSPELPNQPTAVLSEHCRPELPNEATVVTRRSEKRQGTIESTAALTRRHAGDRKQLANGPQRGGRGKEPKGGRKHTERKPLREATLKTVRELAALLRPSELSTWKPPS